MPDAGNGSSALRGLPAEFVAKRTTVPAVIRTLEERGVCILLNATYETYYDVFLPALLMQLADTRDASHKPVAIILDAASYLLRSRYAENLLLHLSDRGPGWRTACFVHTDNPPEEESLQELMRTFVKEAAVIFDVAPKYFGFAFEDLAVSQRAWLLSRFEEIAALQQQGKLGYLTYDRQDSTPLDTQRSTTRVRSRSKAPPQGNPRALASLIAMSIDRLVAKILDEKRMPSEHAQEQDEAKGSSSQS